MLIKHEEMNIVQYNYSTIQVYGLYDSTRSLRMQRKSLPHTAQLHAPPRPRPPHDTSPATCLGDASYRVTARARPRR